MVERKITFNEDATSLFDQLVAQNLTAQPFNDFVRDAFYEKVDAIRAKHRPIELDHATIEKITLDAVQRITKQTAAQQ